MSKLENMRQELSLIEGQDKGAVNVWKDKCKQLVEICKNFKEENEKISLHLNLVQSDLNSVMNTDR
jgi:hypothetical protein